MSTDILLAAGTVYLSKFTYCIRQNNKMAGAGLEFTNILLYKSDE